MEAPVSKKTNFLAYALVCCSLVMASSLMTHEQVHSCSKVMSQLTLTRRACFSAILALGGSHSHDPPLCLLKTIDDYQALMGAQEIFDKHGRYVMHDFDERSPAQTFSRCRWLCAYVISTLTVARHYFFGVRMA
jgi:hypothetical protein